VPLGKFTFPKQNLKHTTMSSYSKPQPSQPQVRFYAKKKATLPNTYSAKFLPFSNFYGTISSLVGSKKTGGSSFEWRGKQYISVENAYQTAKFLGRDDELAEAIRTCSFGAIVFPLGGNGTVFGITANKQLDADDKQNYYRLARQAKKLGVPEDWHETKVSLMAELVELKFRANPDLARLLLSTGNAVIVEASPRDSFWGDHEGGANHLGLVLMQVREKLRSENLKKMQRAQELKIRQKRAHEPTPKSEADGANKRHCSNKKTCITK
jgi:predicted NAD-dependent protein-ADP-ribosyltransferase YbiA (DUF1768 family)